MYATMVQSMTGIGIAEKNGYKIEVRSLNHRFLDISVKSPPFLTHLDMLFRNVLKERFSRGKIDVSISAGSQAVRDFRVNSNLASQIFTAFETLQKDMDLPGKIEITSLLPFHALFLEIDESYDQDAIMELFKDAAGHLADMRTEEGKALSDALIRMVQTLKEMNGRVKGECADTLQAVRDKFSERLQALLAGLEPDRQRILQEAAILAMKYDIAEETARIDSHLEQFSRLLADANGHAAIGKKLDFIIQELNREVNTIGSKSSGYALSALAVEMKTVVEQMREQVQNIQ